MLTQIASFQANIDFNITVFLCLTGLVALWAIMQPATVRDADGRKLPANVTARLLFVFIYVLIFIALVAMVALSGDAASRLGLDGDFKSLIESFKGQAPLVAITLLAAAHSLSYFRDVEKGLIVWLHSARHLSADIRNLTLHLQNCGYDPSSGEKEKNINYLRNFDVYVTSEANANAIQLEAVNAWRKSSTLLRFLRAWNTEKERVLDAADMRQLDELEKAHFRKTRLAMDIIRMLDLVERGAAPESAVTNLATMLADASHKDRNEVAAIEQRLKGAIADHGPDIPRRPVRLTQGQLQQYLAQIESYFRVEYALLLQRIAELAAKSVVLSGDEAPERLANIKAVGFGQLGKIAPVNFDRILWMFFAITLGGFLIFFFWPRPAQTAAATQGPNLWFRIALVMALAALVGAIFGSSRRLAQRSSIPWSAYLAAGLISAGLFVVVHGSADMLRKIQEQGMRPSPTITAAQDQSRAAPGQNATSAARPSAEAAVSRERRFIDTLPFAASPFFIAFAICLLARLKRWPSIPGVPQGVSERILDGLVLCAVVVLAQATSYALHIGFETSMAERLQARWNESPLMFLLRGPALLLGFFVGALVVRDARIAAHSQLTDPSQGPDAEREAEAVFAERGPPGAAMPAPVRSSAA